ncbi:ECF transporter S component [Adlercreutzia sp. ZJ154]|uniref:ECF transporter S component n=1 Tax=Adlercreutzia sp. ZJ154 TaxID=2709790 RepID=UPI0013EAC719|nr:ECF transporter S component [Adlercreutzia sp. ZJ154]
MSNSEKKISTIISTFPFLQKVNTGIDAGAPASVSADVRGAASSSSIARNVVFALAFCAVAVAGRVAFASIASVQPVTAVCIMAGILLGRRYGFAVGAMAAFASNMFLGQGAWTIWQMAAWGLSGWLAGVLGARGLFGCKDAPKVRAGAGGVRTLLVYAYGFFVSLLFGFIMNTWIVAMFGGAMQWQAVVGVYAAGLPFDIAHAVSTVVFLVPMCAIWRYVTYPFENSAEVK